MVFGLCRLAEPTELAESVKMVFSLRSLGWKRSYYFVYVGITPQGDGYVLYLYNPEKTQGLEGFHMINFADFPIDRG